MKKQLVNVLTKIGFLGVMALVTAVGSAQGQSLAYQIRASIPFDFVVGDKKLQAGEYAVGRARQGSTDTFILISSTDGRANTIRLSNAVWSPNPKNKATLVFHRYGDQYFLFQVWPAGADTGRQLPKSQTEREIEDKLAADSSAGKIAKKTQAAETVNIAADLQ